MKESIKNIIRKLTPKRIVKFYQSTIIQKYQDVFSYGNISFSQEGEDLILKRIFNNQNKGFYVDIGAHHPKRFSNTYLFYIEGWRGINIDPKPGIMDIFNELRPLDINLETAIGEKNGCLTYFMFNESALNTFSQEEAKKRDGSKNYYIIEEKEIEVFRLCDILEKYLPKNQKIDFLSVDVEGLDLQVLKSNDWQKFRPEVILAEALDNSLENIMTEELVIFMSEQNYKLFTKTYNTLFFIKR